MKPQPFPAGVPEAERRRIADGLSRLLADTYILHLMTQNFHWNVTGPLFQPLHQMFEAQYSELALAADEVAERIRALAFPAPGTYAAYARLSSIREVEGVPAAEEMIRLLLHGNETAARTAREAFAAADEAGDQPTADLLTERMQAHEKTAWMLRSQLG